MRRRSGQRWGPPGRRSRETPIPQRPTGTPGARKRSPTRGGVPGRTPCLPCRHMGRHPVNTPPPWRKIAIGGGRKIKNPPAGLAPARRVPPRLAGCEKTYLLVPPPLFEAGAFLVPFLWLFLLEVALLEVVLLPLAGAAGVVCANATVEATAKAIAIRLFFISSILPGGHSAARLTVSSCGLSARISIAPAGYGKRRIQG